MSEPVALEGKRGYLVMVTGDVATSAPVTIGRVITFEERIAQQAAHQARADARRADTQARLSAAHPALRPIIEHHTPEPDGYWGYDCAGCDGGGNDEYEASWPCSTIDIIVKGLGPHLDPKDTP